MAQLQAAEQIRPAERTGRPGRIVGSFFLFTGGIHLGLVAADPEFDRHFADEALLPFITSAWQDVFMANPSAWGLALSLCQVALGVLLLLGGSWATIGWAGVIAFHLGLMLIGWGYWLWSVPALAILVPSAVAHWRRQQTQEGPRIR